jgi:hypothetical protein
MLCPYNLKHTEMSRIHGGMFEVGDLEWEIMNLHNHCNTQHFVDIIITHQI